MKYQFKHYLHDSEDDFAWHLQNAIPELKELPDGDFAALMQKIGRPFYEVTLECELDTETGEVTLLSTTL